MSQWGSHHRVFVLAVPPPHKDLPEILSGLAPSCHLDQFKHHVLIEALHDQQSLPPHLPPVPHLPITVVYCLWNSYYHLKLSYIC